MTVPLLGPMKHDTKAIRALHLRNAGEDSALIVRLCGEIDLSRIEAVEYRDELTRLRNTGRRALTGGTE